MIHSLSGGVIKDAGAFTYVKAVFDGEDTPYWFISDFHVEEGDRVVAPKGKFDMPSAATVLRVENNVSGQVAPVSPKRAKRLISPMLSDV